MMVVDRGGGLWWPRPRNGHECCGDIGSRTGTAWFQRLPASYVGYGASHVRCVDTEPLVRRRRI